MYLFFSPTKSIFTPTKFSLLTIHWPISSSPLTLSILLPPFLLPLPLCCFVQAMLNRYFSGSTNAWKELNSSYNFMHVKEKGLQGVTRGKSSIVSCQIHILLLNTLSSTLSSTLSVTPISCCCRVHSQTLSQALSTTHHFLLFLTTYLTSTTTTSFFSHCLFIPHHYHHHPPPSPRIIVMIRDHHCCSWKTQRVTNSLSLPSLALESSGDK